MQVLHLAARGKEQRHGDEHLRDRRPERRAVEREPRDEQEVRRDVLDRNDAHDRRHQPLPVARDEQQAGEVRDGVERDRRREQLKGADRGVVGRAVEEVDRGARQDDSDEADRQREHEDQLQRALEDGPERRRRVRRQLRVDRVDRGADRPTDEERGLEQTVRGAVVADDLLGLERRQHRRVDAEEDGAEHSCKAHRNRGAHERLPESGRDAEPRPHDVPEHQAEREREGEERGREVDRRDGDDPGAGEEGDDPGDARHETLRDQRDRDEDKPLVRLEDGEARTAEDFRDHRQAE